MARQALRQAAGTLLLLACAMLLAADAGARSIGTGLTIHATPNEILSGEGVLVYGRLTGPSSAHQKIQLHARPGCCYAFEATTKTASTGNYSFVLSDGIVKTSRSWYVSGPGGVRSETINEHVLAVVSFVANAPTARTNGSLTFSGHIDPAGHAGENVLLQTLSASASGGWKTIGHARVTASSHFSISHDFHSPGAYEVRAQLPGDALNVVSPSDDLTVTIQQLEHPSFTINSSDPVIDEGQSVTISGHLYAAGSSSTPSAGTSVTLYGHAHGATFAPLGTATTGSDGSYSFSQMPARSGTYQVRTSSGPARSSSPLYQSVSSVVTLSASAATADVGSTVTFTGSITPGSPDSGVQIQLMGPTGAYQDVATGPAGPVSSFTIPYTAASQGSETFRAVVPGSFANAAGASPNITISIAVPPIAKLPVLCTACPPLVIPPKTTATTTTPSPAATVVTVIAGDPMTYSFKLSTAGQPTVSSDRPATQLALPTGEVTFDVTNDAGGIVPHTFEICSTPLPGPVTTLAAVETLPNSCTGTTTPTPPGTLAPGTKASITVDLGSPGTYEYLSTAGGAATGDAFAGMKGVLKVA